ncbi:DUF4286 family protein [Fulvivirga ulvae]|uniref:DUF4286 family protein n=1 Tax=Fulvivirga ulvae TaxID=2904245 RepID=UPI001F35DED7|nr:DUF4286 family protein [Fulvivirga ulvae]UII33418.1 DUF4286 family protein [Fulvivirga ulvae]
MIYENNDNFATIKVELDLLRRIGIRFSRYSTRKNTSMVLYNVTIGIDKDAEKEWLSWMKNKHIPAVMETGMFLEYKIFKVLSHEDEEQSVSYSVQYFAQTVDKVVEYLNNHAPKLVEEHRARYKDKHVAFRTLLEEV